MHELGIKPMTLTSLVIHSTVCATGMTHVSYYQTQYGPKNNYLLYWEYLEALRNTAAGLGPHPHLHLHFTFMHLADAFIQSDLQCIQAIHLYWQYVCSLGIEPTTFPLLTQCSNY